LLFHDKGPENEKARSPSCVRSRGLIYDAISLTLYFCSTPQIWRGVFRVFGIMLDIGIASGGGSFRLLQQSKICLLEH